MDKITRYLFSSSQYSVTNKRVKYNAFKPPRKYPDEVSVYDVSNLSDESIWQMGIEGVESVRSDNKKIKARGDISVEEINKIANEGEPPVLKVEPDPEPHPNHMNITGFTSLHEGQVNIIAKKVADLAKLEIRK
tara:strand:+ start:151119 stop:151520 length:402 start_codon:yes stop_codon:yes gene_type:complete